MSKKNNLDTRRRAREKDLQREKEEQAKREAKLAKNAKSNPAAASCGLVAKRLKQNKAIRLRKGAIIRGIKIVDSDTRKQVQAILKAEAAARMDVDDGVTRRKNPLAVKSASLKKTKKRVVVKKAAPESMEL